MFDTFTLQTEPTVADASDLLAGRDDLSALTVPNGSPVAVPHDSPDTVGAYRDHGLAAAQKGACVCGTSLAITADGALDATYSHVVTDLVTAGARWVGRPVDTRAYRYGLVALAHGACNSRHALAVTLARRAGPTLRAALQYRP